MINTLNFKTRTIFIERENPSLVEKNIWGVSLDIGYSGVKIFSPNSVCCFPSYARKTKGPKIGLGDNVSSDIQYKDRETGEVWNVGESAQQMIASDDATDSTKALYGRNRYFAPMFKVIARTGLALGMMTNKYGSPTDKVLHVETGLPPAYLKSDSLLLRESLSGKHNFDIKIGNGPWMNFCFELPEINIGIMAQPMGTLISIATGKNGKPIPESASYFKSNLLIFDPGFGTLDTFDIRNRFINSYETFDMLGMKAVLSETASSIYNKYNVEISVPAMQKYLESGKVVCFDPKEMKSEEKPFDTLLEEANRAICFEAIDKIKTIYNNLIDYNYLVITGGTGAAWSEMIRTYFKGMQTLKIVSGNQNDDLPYIFSNVRGYYMYMLERLKRV